MTIVAVDIGGTFTDLAGLDPRTGGLYFSKSLTTPPQFEQGALDCILKAGIDISTVDIFRHGTTVVINALLERKGARTALVTTEGFRDILEIGRGNRTDGFDILFTRLPPFVQRMHRLEIAERMDAPGNVLRPIDHAALPALAARLKAEGIEAVAVCLLHAWRNPAHEAEIGRYLREHTGCFVSCSHEISREFREYERASTVVLNAFVGPTVASYLERLETALDSRGFSGRLYLMGSNGGVLTEEDMRTRPLLLVESGPVGGAAGAAEIGARIGQDKIVAFDMGGTTAKAVLIEDGEAAVTPVYWVAGYERGYPVQAAVLDIVEVGTGGGSIASVNELGALEVGPRSAGAAPGPACYGLGGTEPTVTDANLYLGRLDAGHFLGGTMPLYTELAGQALAAIANRFDQPTQALASGILRISTLMMATAVRKITIERGFDPREFTMIAFGGAGPLHAADVAREMGIERVLIPPQPGHFSAYGMLFAGFRFDLTATLAQPLASVDIADMNAQFAGLEAEGLRKLATIGAPIEETRCVRYAEMRYQRQEHTIKVKLPADCETAAEMRERFEDGYARRYGHASGNMAIDVIMLRVVVEGRTARPREQWQGSEAHERAVPARRPVWFAETGLTECDIWQRRTLPAGFKIAGAALIEEDASTTVIGPNDAAEIDRWGNITIDLGVPE
jgi:N-methylhydantoinase A